MRKYFKGIKTEDTDGWPMASCGCSTSEEEEDYMIDTDGLHADEVPEYCMDAKTFSKLVAGLLNCYYNDIETKGLDEEQLIEMGTVEKEKEDISEPDNKNHPF